MRTAVPALAACLLYGGALAAPAFAAANQQQASFSVAITLHTAIKPLSAAELCRDGRAIQTLGATIQVDCSRVLAQPPAADPGSRDASPAAQRRARPEVTVTF